MPNLSCLVPVPRKEDVKEGSPGRRELTLQEWAKPKARAAPKEFNATSAEAVPSLVGHLDPGENSGKWSFYELFELFGR